ncbi:MAG: hypothetical protein WBN09_00900 [Woeseiaceae bacterium]
MSRSRFAYPLTRNFDGDAGGAADLQTDVMRFMAILSLCLMAIFALVQSLPVAPVPTPAEVPPAAAPIPVEHVQPVEPVKPARPVARVAKPTAEPATEPTASEAIILTMPKWQPAAVAAEAEPTVVDAPAAIAEPDGFSLRFESDQALMRLVASSKVGLYAIDAGRAQRMTVSDSRISFWDASTPNTFHEMESATVPMPVVDALARTGSSTAAVSWGVTLPQKLRAQLDSLMAGRSGGDLVIGTDGNLRLDES